MLIQTLSLKFAFIVRLASEFSINFLQGQYEILSLSGSFIRAEQGGKTGGLSVSLSRSDGQIIGGAVGTHLISAGPVQVKSCCIIVAYAYPFFV